MPYHEIKLENIIFDPKVQTYCNNPQYRCPNFGHSHACPPVAPYMEDRVSSFKKFYLIYYQLDLNDYIKKIKAKHPKRKEKAIKNSIYRKNLVRGYLEAEIFNFLETFDQNYDEKLVLWDGSCRLCHIKKNKGCTYDAGDPCRYPTEIRYSMEAVGIDVNATVSCLNIDLEWPPLNYLYRFGLACFK